MTDEQNGPNEDGKSVIEAIIPKPAVRTTEVEIGPPPIMKTWRRFYGLVIAVLVADVVVFWLVTRIFS